MEFYKYTDSWSFLKQFNLQSHFESREQWWELQEQMSETYDSPFMYRRVLLEKKWIASERPYYNCYPAILPMLMKLKLDIPCSSLRGMSIEPIEVRLPRADREPIRLGRASCPHSILRHSADATRGWERRAHRRHLHLL